MATPAYCPALLHRPERSRVNQSHRRYFSPPRWFCRTGSGERSRHIEPPCPATELVVVSFCVFACRTHHHSPCAYALVLAVPDLWPISLWREPTTTKSIVGLVGTSLWRVSL